MLLSDVQRHRAHSRLRCREEKRIDQDRRDTFRLDIDRCRQCCRNGRKRPSWTYFARHGSCRRGVGKLACRDKDHSRSFFRSRMDQHTVQHCKRCMPKGRCSLRARQTCQRRTPYNWFAQPATGTSLLAGSAVYSPLNVLIETFWASFAGSAGQFGRKRPSWTYSFRHSSCRRGVGKLAYGTRITVGLSSGLGWISIRPALQAVHAEGRCSLRARQTCQRRTRTIGLPNQRLVRPILAGNAVSSPLNVLIETFWTSFAILLRGRSWYVPGGTTVCRHTKRSSQYTGLCCPAG